MNIREVGTDRQTYEIYASKVILNENFVFFQYWDRVVFSILKHFWATGLLDDDGLHRLRY